MDHEATAVRWRRGDPDEVSSPLVRRVPYLELKLEHSDLEPTGYADRFFPDAVPYELDGEKRVFYWRSALTPSSTPAEDWQAACATTDALTGITALPARPPDLAASDADGATVIVDGTVAGDATTARLRSYARPSVHLEGISDGSVELTVDGTEYSVERGERRRLPLEERLVESIDAAGDSKDVRPELVARYPGRRRIHHPPPDASSLLFPSFDLDLDAVPEPLAVPTAAGELDDAALAADLGVDLAARPYPERVLWQAMAYTAFDPHAENVPVVVQLASGHLVVRTDDEDCDENEGVTERG